MDNVKKGRCAKCGNEALETESSIFDDGLLIGPEEGPHLPLAVHILCDEERPERWLSLGYNQEAAEAMVNSVKMHREASECYDKIPAVEDEYQAKIQALLAEKEEVIASLRLESVTKRKAGNDWHREAGVILDRAGIKPQI